MAHSTCSKSVRVDHFRWSGAENEGFVWEGWKKAWRRATGEGKENGGEMVGADGQTDRQTDRPTN